jgi:hypothetical protein
LRHVNAQYPLVLNRSGFAIVKKHKPESRRVK